MFKIEYIITGSVSFLILTLTIFYMIWSYKKRQKNYLKLSSILQAYFNEDIIKYNIRKIQKIEFYFSHHKKYNLRINDLKDLNEDIKEFMINNQLKIKQFKINLINQKMFQKLTKKISHKFKIFNSKFNFFEEKIMIYEALKLKLIDNIFQLSKFIEEINFSQKLKINAIDFLLKLKNQYKELFINSAEKLFEKNSIKINEINDQIIFILNSKKYDNFFKKQVNDKCQAINKYVITNQLQNKQNIDKIVNEIKKIKEQAYAEIEDINFINVKVFTDQIIDHFKSIKSIIFNENEVKKVIDLSKRVFDKNKKEFIKIWNYQFHTIKFSKVNKIVELNEKNKNINRLESIKHNFFKNYDAFYSLISKEKDSIIKINKLHQINQNIIDILKINLLDNDVKLIFESINFINIIIKWLKVNSKNKLEHQKIIKIEKHLQTYYHYDYNQKNLITYLKQIEKIVLNMFKMMIKLENEAIYKQIASQTKISNTVEYYAINQKFLLALKEIIN